MMDIENDNYRLAQKACRGDLEALSELIECTRAQLFGLAYAELRHYEDAQDVVVAALHQICLHIDQLQDPQCVNAWMNSIVRNEVRQLRRRWLPDKACVELDDTGCPTAHIDSCLLRIDIEQALRHLPQDQARVIELFYWQHLSTHEIAARLQRPEGSIRRWLHLGRRQLAVEMKEYGSMKSAETAAILHTDLSASALRPLKKALRAGGYQVRIVEPSDVTSVSYGPGVARPLGNYAFIILDEFIEGRSALEYVLHLKSFQETASIPVCVLCSEPSDFTVGAYFSAGVDRLVNRDQAQDIDRLRLLNLRLKGKRIVVVEDEEITRAQIAAGLARVGLSVAGIAANGKDGVEMVLRVRPDIVIMGIDMPVMDGLKATRQIMAKFRACVVMLTSNPDRQEQARLAGASGYITKPVTSTMLRLQLHEALDRFHRADLGRR